MKQRLIFRVHAVQRMFERNVSMKRVKRAVDTGVTVEDYSAEMPESGRLILDYQGHRPLHLVISENLETNLTTIITVYIPDSNKWDKHYMSRKA